MFSHLCRGLRWPTIGRTLSTRHTTHNGAPGIVGITTAVALKCGKLVDIEFLDGSKYRFHVEWLKDSSPSDIGPDEYRLQPELVYDLPSLAAQSAVPTNDGKEVEVAFKHGDCTTGSSSGDARLVTTAETFDARFLYAAAPFVGKVITESVPAIGSVVTGTAMMAGPTRHGWIANGFKIPEFDLAAITEDVDAHIEFMQCVLFQPGVAFVHGVQPPDDLLDELRIGAPLENAARKLVGRLNQHTNRTTRYSVTHAAADSDGMTKPEPIQKSMDYDCGFRLPMHTDHSQFPGMPGYLQFMQNLQGDVQSYVTDGLAVAHYIKEHYPDDFELLTTVQVTHSFRNKLYTESGAYKNIAAEDDHQDPTDPYEVCHTHPVIILASDGTGDIERIAHSETKRGVCAIPFDVYQPFMRAYRRWMTLVEDPMFVHKFDWPENGMIICNNYRVLHGRADLAPGDERTLIVGYSGKSLTDNRYRLLCQEKAKRDHFSNNNSKWTSRLPNQVLSRMILSTYV